MSMPKENLQAGDRLVVHLDRIEIKVPPGGLDNATSLKEWLWLRRKEEILQALSVALLISPSKPSSTKQNGTDQAEEDRHLVQPTTPSTPLPKIVADPQRTLEVITNVQQRLLDNERPRLLYGYLLEALLSCSGSAFGFVADVKIDGANHPIATARACTNLDQNNQVNRLYEVAVEPVNAANNLLPFFQAALTTGLPVISNDPTNDPRSYGVPEDHIPLQAYLGIPLFKNQKVVGLLGLANKPGGYSQADIDMLQPLTVTIGLLLQVFLHIDKNEFHINNMQECVREHTDKLALANAKLEQANGRVAAASEAQLLHFDRISHEIRTPLNCIVGLTSLLQETITTPIQDDSLRMIRSSSDLLLTVVNDVLDYSNLVNSELTLNVQRTSLQDVLNTIVHLIGLRGEPKHIQLNTKFLDVCVPEYIQTDGYRLQQVLYNLLGNSINFSSPSGIVELSVRVKPFSADNPSLRNVFTGQYSFQGLRSNLENEVSSVLSSVRETGDSQQAFASQDVLCFTIKDYGKGICKKDFERIFQPFRQADSEEKNIAGGTGLGLAVVSRIVRAMGGRVTVDSKEGEWTEFTLQIPLVEACLPQEDDTTSKTELSESLENTIVAFVGIHYSNMMEVPVYSLLADFGVECVNCGTLAELKELMEAKTHLRMESACVVVTTEDAYDPASFKSINTSILTGLVTLGPEFIVPEAAARFASLDSTLPSVLLRTIRHTAGEIRARSKYDSSSKKPKQTSNSTIPYKEWRILIAEDNKVNQKVLQRLLNKLGVENINIAKNGREAVEMAKSTKYDLVLMDMQMPEMDGLEACQEILGNIEAIGGSGSENPMIVFVSAHVSSDSKVACREAGGLDFLPKPVNYRALESLFQSLSARRNGDRKIG